jgi:hypothetical protein
MKIDGKVHCFFEQSGTFKNEFIYARNWICDFVIGKDQHLEPVLFDFDEE